ncbi:MAG: S41 family peptidase [Planctomycetaceae bacterium]
MTRRQFLLLIVPLLAVLLGFVAVGLLEDRGTGDGIFWDERLERYLRQSLAEDFVRGAGDEREAQAAFFHAMNEYLRRFDRIHSLTPPWEVKETEQRNSGRYVGIGVRTEPVEEEGRIVRLRLNGIKPKGPADTAGLKIGESILAVEGTLIVDLCADGTIRGAVEAIQGEEKTAVRLRIAGASGIEREVSMLRLRIPQGSVFGARIVDPDKGTGYLHLSDFHADTGRDFREKLEALRRQGMTALVLDLRGNRGGYLDQALSVAGAFLDSGVIVRVRKRGVTEVLSASPEDTDGRDLPLALLVDRDSASSSEVLAGALQDHRRAVLVGEPTFGKFSVQTIQRVTTAAGEALVKITTAVYETPSGRFYPRETEEGASRDAVDPLAGLRPDLHVPLSKAEREILAAVFDNEPMADWNLEHPPVHPEFVDRQLLAAVALLRGETVTPELVSDP